MFEVQDLELPDVKLITPKLHRDNRGFFYEMYKASDFLQYDFPLFVQDNMSYSNKNVLRGLHYQKEPYGQGKLLTVLRGEILDLIVDIRPDSKTFLGHISLVLDYKDNNLVYIPAGFAHGFLALDNNTLVMYKTTKEYSINHDAGIVWNDPTINFDWPIDNPILSDKDKNLPEIKEIMNG